MTKGFAHSKIYPKCLNFSLNRLMVMTLLLLCYLSTSLAFLIFNYSLLRYSVRYFIRVRNNKMVVLLPWTILHLLGICMEEMCCGNVNKFGSKEFIIYLYKKGSWPILHVFNGICLSICSYFLWDAFFYIWNMQSTVKFKADNNFVFF